MIKFTRRIGLGAPPWANDSSEIALTWDYFWIEPAQPKWYPLATAACANGHLASVSPQVHTISPDGTLSPSYVCPRSDCSFHEFVQFEGWGQ